MGSVRKVTAAGAQGHVLGPLKSDTVHVDTVHVEMIWLKNVSWDPSRIFAAQTQIKATIKSE